MKTLDLLKELTLELQRKHDEEQEINELFRISFDRSPVGMALVNCNGGWIRVNKALCDLVGYSEEELKNTDFQTITHQEDLAGDVDLMNRVLSGSIDGYKLDKRYIGKYGETIPVTIYVDIMFDAGKKPKYFIVHILSRK